MISSMTGYGEGTSQGNGWTVRVKMKTLNHKYIDLYMRGLEDFELVEMETREKIKNHFSRGRVEVTFELEPENEKTFNLDPELAGKYYSALKDLAQELKLEHAITLDHLSRLPGAIKPLPVEPGELGPVLEDSLKQAIEATSEMRDKEGAALAEELHDLSNSVGQELMEVEKRVPELKEQYRAKLHERISDLNLEIEIDADRLQQEVVVWAERSDITEEVARLKIHLKSFQDGLQTDEAAGRTLDFLAQEMGREVNTMGAKARDGDIARHIIEMKAHIERIREQVRNVE
jgi:uncharacterized protein (TIGR00255 family)